MEKQVPQTGTAHEINHLQYALLAYSMWGEMAYRLAGRKGYERIRQSDEKHIAPAPTEFPLADWPGVTVLAIA